MFVDGQAIKLTEVQGHVYDLGWNLLSAAFPACEIEYRDDKDMVFVVLDRGCEYRVTPVQEFAIRQVFSMLANVFPGAELETVDDEIRITIPDRDYFEAAPPLHAVGSEPKARIKPVPDGGNGLAVAA